MGTILLSLGGKFANKTVALGGGGFKYFQCSTLYGIFTFMYLVDFYGFHIPFMDPMDVIFGIGNVKVFKIPKSPYIVWVWTPEDFIWSNYSNITRPPKGSWGREIPLISGTSRLVKHYILARLYLCHESNGRYFVVRLVMSQQNFSSLCCLENVGNNWHGIWWKFQEIAPINQHQLGFGFISGLGWMKWMMDMKSREIYTIPPFLKDLVFIASTQAGRRYYTIIWSWQLYVPIPSMYDINLPTSGWFLWFSCI